MVSVGESAELLNGKVRYGRRWHTGIVTILCALIGLLYSYSVEKGDLARNILICLWPRWIIKLFT